VAKLHDADASDPVYAGFWMIIMGTMLLAVMGGFFLVAATIRHWAIELMHAINGPPK
jgi:hypothetical protein